jgi:hypothetical protein
MIRHAGKLKELLYRGGIIKRASLHLKTFVITCMYWMKAVTVPNFLYQDTKRIREANTQGLILREVRKCDTCKLTSNVVAEDT